MNHFGIETLVRFPGRSLSYWVIIEPFWNWNTVQYNAFRKALSCNNWTILELKHLCANLRIRDRNGNNWTILELKPFMNLCVSNRKTCNNWTILELKLSLILFVKLYHSRNNWTILELKLNIDLHGIPVRRSNNWTILELKLLSTQEVFKCIRVIIEPFWNWNCITWEISNSLIIR